MNHEIPSVKKKSRTHYFQSRDFELATKVQGLPGTALIDSHELAALTGIAPTSFAKPSQRDQMGLPAPIRLGRLMKWRFEDIRIWLGQMPSELQIPATPRAPGLPRRGRPTKAEQLAREAEQKANAEAKASAQ